MSSSSNHRQQSDSSPSVDWNSMVQYASSIEALIKLHKDSRTGDRLQRLHGAFERHSKDPTINCNNIVCGRSGGAKGKGCFGNQIARLAYLIEKLKSSIRCFDPSRIPEEWIYKYGSLRLMIDERTAEMGCDPSRYDELIAETRALMSVAEFSQESGTSAALMAMKEDLELACAELENRRKLEEILKATMRSRTEAKGRLAEG